MIQEFIHVSQYQDSVKAIIGIRTFYFISIETDNTLSMFIIHILPYKSSKFSTITTFKQNPWLTEDNHNKKGTWF